MCRCFALGNSIFKMLLLSTDKKYVGDVFGQIWFTYGNQKSYSHQPNTITTTAEIIPREGNVDILLIVHRLLTMQCKWTFTERFTLSTPLRKFLMKARAPFASFSNSYSGGGVYEFAKSVQFLSQHLLNWRITQYNSNDCQLKTTKSELDLNYPQIHLWCSNYSVLVERHFSICSLKCFLHFGYQQWCSKGSRGPRAARLPVE